MQSRHDKPIRILTELCSVPTAPFVEAEVAGYADRFVTTRRRLRLTRDDFGNLLIELAGKKESPRWVFTAHMDHPGFVARRMIDRSTLEADFFGGVLGDYFDGSRVRFFHGGQETAGVVKTHRAGKQGPYPDRAMIEVRSPVPAGAPGMWDQGSGRVKGRRFYSRVCDDLAGAAAALAMLDELHRRPPAAPVAVLLTRAEEEGFIGAIAASIEPKLLRKSDRIIAIECSAVQSYAPQGGGAVIRVGDRTSIFNSALTHFITEQATALAAKDTEFHYQRALMPGGTCEATVYDLYGFTAASICVPLGNYHNMDRAKKRIGPEYIDVRDWRSMVKLFVQVARNGHRYEPGMKGLKQKLEGRFARMKRFL